MSPIKDFVLRYDSLNETNTFGEGDTVTGRLVFTLKKDTKVKTLGVKVKGLAYVHWSEGGDNDRWYTATREYFNVKQKFVEKKSNGTELPKGDHCYKFSLRIPEGNMPSSFKGFHGYITYTLEAKLSRSWKMSTVERQELRFASKSLLMPSQVFERLQLFDQFVAASKNWLKVKDWQTGYGEIPVSGSVDKGGVQMTATVDKQICFPGDTLSVTAKICNSSSKKMKPKFNLMQTTTYSAEGSTERSFVSQCKVVGDTIAPNSQETASCQLMVPAEAISTINNCDIISLNYSVKVYLDIKFAIDPEVVLPVFIAPVKFASHGPYTTGPTGAPSYSDFPPPSFPMGPYPVPGGPSAPPQPGQAFGPPPAGAFGSPGYSQFPPSFPTSSYPAPTAPGGYGYSAPNLNQPNNQWPQQAPPYGYPAAPFPPLSVQPQAPTEENPPAYQSLFPPSSRS